MTGAHTRDGAGASRAPLDGIREELVTLPDNTVVVEVTETVIGQLAAVQIAPEDLVRAGGSRFTLVPDAGTTPITLGEDAVVIQGALEETNIDMARSSTDLMSLARVYTSNQQVFTALNESLQLAVRDIGRVG